MTNLPSHGAMERPEHLKVKDRVYAAVTPFDWSQIKEDPIGNVAGIYGLPDREQGSSLSCTCQTMGYGFAYCTHIEISRKDVYSKVRLVTGGAYLNAPLDFGRKTGFVKLEKYPDPDSQTEDNMSGIVQVKVGDRIRTFQITYTFYSDVKNIDSAALALQNHQYIHLGIRGAWADGWNKTWVDPMPPAKMNTNYWQHALFAGKEGLVLRNGVPAIKTKSSWNKHTDYVGNPSHCHYLNKNYFSNDGVFEIIGVDIKELESMKLVSVKGTTYLKGNKGAMGVADPKSAALLALLDDTAPETMSALDVPQIGTLTHDDAYIIHK